MGSLLRGQASCWGGHGRSGWQSFYPLLGKSEAQQEGNGEGRLLGERPFFGMNGLIARDSFGMKFSIIQEKGHADPNFEPSLSYALLLHPVPKTGP